MAFFGLERLSFQGVANANHEIKAAEAGGGIASLCSPPLGLLASW